MVTLTPWSGCGGRGCGHDLHRPHVLRLWWPPPPTPSSEGHDHAAARAPVRAIRRTAAQGRANAEAEREKLKHLAPAWRAAYRDVASGRVNTYRTLTDRQYEAGVKAALREGVHVRGSEG